MQKALGQERMLGMDVRPEAMGASDSSLFEAMEEAVARDPAAAEARRRTAERALLSAALRGRRGPWIAPMVASQLVLLRRLSRMKGQVAEDLSVALLHLRAAALAALAAPVEPILPTFAFFTEARKLSTERPVLAGVNLDVRPGETIALVGRSGAGKTTFCNLVARLYDPTSGQILLDGRDLRDIRVDQF